MRFLIVALFIASPLRADDFSNFSGAGRDAKTDQLSFTGTQRWGREFLQSTRERPKYLASDWKGKVALPVPPANSSARTAAELAYLKPLVSKRAERMSEINAEVHVTKFRFGEHTYKSLTTEARYRATGKALARGLP